MSERPSEYRVRPGTISQSEACGCTIKGIGTLGRPWAVAYCDTHGQAEATKAHMDECLQILSEIETAVCNEQDPITAGMIARISNALEGPKLQTLTDDSDADAQTSATDE